MLESILFFLLYISILSYIIWRHPFFILKDIPEPWALAGFWIKIAGGTVLSLVYTYYYTDRSTADIYKYFDDAKVLYGAAFEHPIDFLKIMTGLGNDSPYFDTTYYTKMNHWYRQYSAYYNDNHTIIRWNAMVMFLSGGHFMVHTVFMCFLSTMGLIGIFRSFSDQSAPRPLFLLLFLTPSLAFWGSGVLKEGLVLFGLGGLFWSLKVWMSGKAGKGFLFVFSMAFIMLLSSKYYLLAILFPGLLALGMIRLVKSEKPSLWFGISYTLAVLVFFSVGRISSSLDPAANLAHKQKDFIKLANGGMYVERKDSLFTDTLFISALEYVHIKKENGLAYLNQVRVWQVYHDQNLGPITANEQLGKTLPTRILLDIGVTKSKVALPALDSSWESYFKAAPQALFNVFIQPIHPGKNPLYWLALLENCFLLLLLLFCFWPPLPFRTWAGSPIHLLALFFVAGSLLLIGLTTPVAGALVRYKIPALPFLFGLVLVGKGKKEE
jgi:hypothetical protein